MIKRVFSLSFAAFIFFSGPAFCAPEIISFFDEAVPGSAVETERIDNNIHFVKDYNGVITDVYKNFVNAIFCIVLPDDASRFPEKFQSASKTVFITDFIFPPHFTENKINRKNFFYVFAGNSAFFASGAGLSVFVYMFILWYIGLLRLFSGDSFVFKQIKILRIPVFSSAGIFFIFRYMKINETKGSIL